MKATKIPARRCIGSAPCVLAAQIARKSGVGWVKNATDGSAVPVNPKDLRSIGISLFADNIRLADRVKATVCLPLLRRQDRNRDRVFPGAADLQHERARRKLVFHCLADAVTIYGAYSYPLPRGRPSPPRPLGLHGICHENKSDRAAAGVTTQGVRLIITSIPR